MAGQNNPAPAGTAVSHPSDPRPPASTPGRPTPIATAIPGTPATAVPATPTLPFSPGSAIRLIGPPANGGFFAGNSVSFLWEWDEPLKEGQAFALFLLLEDGEQRLDTIEAPNLGSRYRVSAELPRPDAGETAVTIEWQVRLLDQSSGATLLNSPARSLTLLASP